MSRIIRRIRNRSSVEDLDHEVVEPSPESERAQIRRMRPIQKPKTMAWHGRLSGPDMTKVLKGFMPTDMDQKWVIASDRPNEQGIIDVHIARSWTQYEIYTVKIRVLAGKDGKPGDAEKDGGEVFEIVCEASNEYDNTCDSEIEDMAIGLCRGFLDIRLDCEPKPRAPVTHKR